MGTAVRGHTRPRLEPEYGASCRWEPISIHKASGSESDNCTEQLADFKRRKHANMAVGKHGRDVFLADTSYATMALAQENFKGYPIPLYVGILGYS